MKDFGHGRLLAIYGPALPVIELRAAECGMCPSEFVERICEAWVRLGAPVVDHAEKFGREKLNKTRLPAVVKARAA